MDQITDICKKNSWNIDRNKLCLWSVSASITMLIVLSLSIHEDWMFLHLSIFLLISLHSIYYFSVGKSFTSLDKLISRYVLFMWYFKWNYFICFLLRLLIYNLFIETKLILTSNFVEIILLIFCFLVYSLVFSIFFLTCEWK